MGERRVLGALLVLGVGAGIGIGFATGFGFRWGIALGSIFALLPIFVVRFRRFQPLEQASNDLALGRFEAAEKILGGYLESPWLRGGRARIKATLSLALAEWYLDKADQAIERAKELLKVCEEKPDPELEIHVRVLEVACLLQLKKSLAVHDAAERLSATEGLSPEELGLAKVQVAVCAMNQELFQEAIEFFDGALELLEGKEHKAYVYGLKSASYNRVKDYDRALENVSLGQALSPQEAQTQAILHDNFAFAKANLRQDLDQALEAVEAGIALEIPAAMPHLFTSRGEVQYARAEFDAALEDLEKALELLPERDRNARQKAWFIKGKIHKARGEDQEALRALSEAISIDSSKTIAMNAQAILASPQGLESLSHPGIPPG